MTAHPKDVASPQGAPLWMTWLRRLGIAAVGVLIGALVARLTGELWPLVGSLGRPSITPCWVWSPLFTLISMLTGAFIALWSLGLFRRGAVPRDGAWTYLWPLVLAALYLAQPLRLPIWGMAALMAGLGGTLWLFAQASLKLRTWARWTWLGDALLFSLALALYLSTLAPSVLPGDSGEFQFVAPTLGIPHPTGYPLYLLLGKLLSLLPIGSVAYRLNLLSALAAAGAVWAVYRAGRALGLRRAAAMLGAGLLAVSSTLWSQATIAEKYSLNAFFVALTLWLGLQWRRSHLAAEDRAAPMDRVPRRWLYAWAFCYGLSLAHHRTMLLLAPAYALLVWTTDRTLVHNGRLVLGLALLALAPLSLYLLLPLFSALNPPYAYQRIDSVSAFFDLVLARAYQGSLFRGGWRGLWPRVAEGGRLLARQFGWPGLLVSVLGVGVVWRRDRRVGRVLLLGMAAQFGFALNYYVPNTYVYYLPVYVWLAVFAAAGVDAALRAASAVTLAAAATTNGRGTARSSVLSRVQETAKAVTMNGGGHSLTLGRRDLSRLGAHLTLACALLAAAWIVRLCAARWSGMDQKQAYRHQAFDDNYGRMAARSVEEGALIVGDWMPATVLWYAQTIEGRMRGAQITVADPLESLWRGPVEAALAAGRPVYLARPVMGVGDRFALSSSGPLVQVLERRRSSVPEIDFAIVAGDAGSATDEIVLLGANLVASRAGTGGGLTRLVSYTDTPVWGGGTLYATLFWQARRVPQGDYGVQVRWMDAFGHVWVEQQARHPVGGTYPTSRWQAGEVVADHYALDLPAHLGAGDYLLQVALGPPGADVPWIRVATVHLLPAWGNKLPSGTQVRKAFGGGWVLTGYDAPSEWVPGETVSVALQWLNCAAAVRSPLEEGRQPQLWLVDREGTARVVEPLAGAESRAPQVVEWFRFAIDDDLARVEVRGLAPYGLGQVRFRMPVSVSSELPGTNFDNKLRLRSAIYRDDVYHPGETVQLVLEWEAMRSMDEAYKVFVHVLGPDGLPIAQQDNEPLNGTYPTTRWQPGERVSDQYAIALPADLAPGEYAVEVGLYRISDLTRLPVLDPDQDVVDDKLYLTPLVIQ